MASHDFIEKMNQEFDKLIEADGDLIPALAAKQLADRLHEEDPGLLYGWLDTMAETLLAERLAQRNRARRMSWHRERNRREFQEKLAAGGAAAFGIYRLRFLASDGSQRLFTQMTLEDVRWLSGDYRRRSSELARRALYFAAAGDKMAAAGAATVGALPPEDLAELGQLWDEVSGQAGTEAEAGTA